MFSETKAWLVLLSILFCGPLFYLQNLLLEGGRDLESEVENAGPRGERKRSWSSKCPLAVQKNVGIFANSSNSPMKDKFQDVVLLVSSNTAYLDFLQNWEYLASQLHLQWAVLAMDEDLHHQLGEERAVPSLSEYSVLGVQHFRKGGFNTLTCNKMRMVLSVAEECDVDVLFTDADNIFYHNPLDHDLGRLVESRRYDYIYQPNSKNVGAEPRNHQCLQGHPEREANTGFYYMNRNSHFMKHVINATLYRCEQPSNRLDDQTLFWQEVWKHHLEDNTTMHHCKLDEYESPSTVNVEASKDVDFSFCCLDPHYYPIGFADPPYNNDSITFHANYAKGKEGKIQKLLRSRSDQYGWNTTRLVATTA